MLMIRVDDFPYVKTEECWKHNLESFKSFDEIMEKHCLDYVLGCIPRHTTREHLEWLSHNPRIEVALHGIDHDERFQNEFREHQTKQDIYQAINSVKFLWDPLVGPVTTYIPPHNVIDVKTVDALKECGFKTILGGPGSDPNVFEYAFLHGFMVQFSYPETGLYGRSDELLRDGAQKKIHGLINPCSSAIGYLSLHWTWERNIGFDSLDRFLTVLENGDVNQ